jgi:hypothetical protein
MHLKSLPDGVEATGSIPRRPAATRALHIKFIQEREKVILKGGVEGYYFSTSNNKQRADFSASVVVFLSCF